MLELPTGLFLLAGVALVSIGAILIFNGVAALMRSRPMRFALRTLAGLLLVSLGLLAGAVATGIHGYRALTREEVAARLSVRPTGPQRLTATIRYPDGREAVYELAGDEIYVDAHILKWKPMANLLGLHTAYELDRIAGRFRSIEQERSAPRTVYALGRERPLDLFGLRQRYAFLAPLLDAEYGSATFTSVTRPVELELRVSATGLLMRDANAGSQTKP
jgi:hypothetical protein